MFNRQVSCVIAGAAGAAALTAASAPAPLYPVYQHLWGFSAFTLTVVFAVYVAALLTALLTVGSLSDRVGRRPVASGALVLLAIGTLLFVIAGDTGGLMAARIVQGFAVGAATGTLTAMILDSAANERIGSIVSSAVPSLGITIGAVLAGALVEFAPLPRQLVFWMLAAVYLVLAGLVWFVPERARPAPTSRESIWQSLVPSARVPKGTRSVFFALVPSIVATWALSGLYLSLGSSIIGTVLLVHSHFVVGLVLGAFFIGGTIGTAASATLPASLREGFGYATLAFGVIVTLAAILMTALPLYILGSVVAGLGFGGSFRFAVNSLGEAAPIGQRGQIFATMYIVSYLGFSVPALVAGLAVGLFGLEPTTVVYGAMVIALILVAALAGRSQARRRARAKKLQPAGALLREPEGSRPPPQ